MNTNPLIQLFSALSGKKTYFTTAAIGVLLFGQWQGWWKIDQTIYLALTAAAVAFLRAGVAKASSDTSETPSASATPPAPPTTPTGGTGSGMNFVKLPLMLAFASLILTLITSSLITGCGTTTPEQVTYQAAGTTVVSVDTAMNLWGAYVAAKHPPAAQEMAVRTAYERYQAAMATACDAGAVYAATTVTNAAGTSTASLALQQATAKASQELADLENLIASFGVKLQ